MSSNEHIQPQSASDALLAEILGDVHKLRTEISSFQAAMPDATRKLIIAANHLSKTAESFKLASEHVKEDINKHINSRVLEAEKRIQEIKPHAEIQGNLDSVKASNRGIEKTTVILTALNFLLLLVVFLKH